MSNRVVRNLCSLLTICWSSAVSGQPVEARTQLYADGAAKGWRFRPWNMVWCERPGGSGRGGKCLWFNLDWKAHPWAGVTFERTNGAALILDRPWLDRGFVRFYLNVGVDLYGFPGGGVNFQVRPLVPGIRYQAVRGGFIDRGRGADEDLGTWQEVLIPLSYWTELEPGQAVPGVSIQCRGRPARTFGLDEVGFVRFAQRPEWLTKRLTEAVAQPWVKWPDYESLSDVLKADQHPPRVVKGRFVWPDGRRVFLLSPYCREDPRLDLWGTTQEGKCAPNHGLYNPKAHGWIYQESPTGRNLCRLGFNTYSATMPPQPWWDAVEFKGKDRSASAGRLPQFYARVKLPFYIDTVAWPWTLGKPHTAKDTGLPPEAFTQGRNHWTPYRTIGAGRQTWLRMWRLYAQRYRDAGVPAFIMELMNEPAYVGVSDDHRREFVAWLQQRYRSLSALNQTWRSNFTSWDQAADFSRDPKLQNVPGRYFDYDEYLATRFTKLVALGVDAVTKILPDTLVGVQTMSGFALRPRESVWKHRFTLHETVVLTPTGGGRWTQGGSCVRVPATPLEAPIARAPFENDLLLALARSKMIFDNETYLRGQTALEVRNRLWEQVVAGLDGLTIFSWSKRGWAWWRDRAQVQTEADKFPFSNLIPLARRAEALRGIYDFAAEVQPIADRILPKPWSPRPAIGVFYSWAHARWMSLKPDLPDKTGDYYAALKYTHWNLGVLPSHQALDGALKRYDVVVAPGLTHIERELLRKLQEFVQQGGVLIAGEQALNRDLYDRPLDSAWLGVEIGAKESGGGALTSFPAEADTRLPGPVHLPAGVRRVRLLPGTEPVLCDDAGRIVLTRRRVGRGLVYFQAADAIGYPLAKILWAALDDAAKATNRGAIPDRWRLADITEADTARLATNVLLSRRSYAGRHALLLLNLDGYDKRLRIRMEGLTGAWHVTNGLTGKSLVSPSGSAWCAKELAAGLPIAIPAGGPAVLLLDALSPSVGGR